MRGSKINGWRGEFKSSFLSCEKDTEAIIKKLFVDSKPYSDLLKRLLTDSINNWIVLFWLEIPSLLSESNHGFGNNILIIPPK